MPRKPPIELQELKKSGLLQERRFYELLSAGANYSDPESTKRHYLALVKLIVAELRKNGVVSLPHLGEFALVKQKDRLGWLGNMRGMIRGAYVLKFYPKTLLRQYFSKFQAATEAKLDPRERLLNKKI